MPIADKNRIYDGWLSQQGGVDAGRAPDTIDPTQAQSAINMTFRGGSPTTRPGIRKLNESFPDPGNAVYCRNDTGQYGSLSTITVSSESPVITTSQPHLLFPNAPVLFITTGIIPPPLVANQVYYAASPITTNTFCISATIGGPLITIQRPGHGPSFLVPYYFGLQDTETIYRTGVFQCASVYNPHHGEDAIMVLVGGRLFKVIPDITTARAEELSVKDDSTDKPLRNNQYKTIAYMCQADKWFVAQDGESSAILYDNTTARRTTLTSDPSKFEVPVGTIMAYGMGRLCVVVNQRDIAFGDLLGSHVPGDPGDSLIQFTERNFLAEGLDAAIPFQQGLVTGMIFFPQLDTSTGNGQLLAFAERGASSFFLSLDRTQWKTSEFQILSLLTTGMRGHRSIAVVNEDLWFRADDGVRNFRQSRSEPSGYAHIPLSTNVEQYLNNDSDWMLKYASGMYFDNRCLFTTSPAPNQGRPIHYGLVVVDFHILSSFGANSNPAWEGEWVLTPNANGNIYPLQVLTGTFKGVTRSFLFALTPVTDANNNVVWQNQLYELSRDDTDDWDDQLISWELVTRAFDFQKLSQQSTPFNENELYGGDMWLREIVE